MKNTSSWFTIEAIDDKTFAISEYGHWEQTHAYLLIGNKRAALIDTGTGIGDIRQAVEKLTNLPILVITTHCHWDHIGGHAQFDHLAIHTDDRAWLEEGLPLPPSAIKAQVVKEPFTRSTPTNFDIDQYQVFTGKAELILHDENIIDLGGRTLCILHTPGHSPGHICIYEEEHGYVFTGDILYKGTIYANYPSTDPQALADSIRKLTTLPDVKKLLPGHNQLNIPLSMLTDFHQHCERLCENGLLQHGTGLHQTNGIALLL